MGSKDINLQGAIVLENFISEDEEAYISKQVSEGDWVKS